MTSVRFSVCATNYNCAHTLGRHLASVFDGLLQFDFEYLVVDNKSKDGSEPILRRWESTHPNMRVWIQRCTMGRGRQIAFERSIGNYIVTLDTDVVYSSALPEFLLRYLAMTPNLAVQAQYCGVFPRIIWDQAGGRRSLNTCEDTDMWARIAGTGKMRWYAFALGENVKESYATGGDDFLSGRYDRGERVRRVFRRHYDLWKTRWLSSLDLVSICQDNQVDYGLGPTFEHWFDNRPRLSLTRRGAAMMREIRQAWTGNTGYKD